MSTRNNGRKAGSRRIAVGAWLAFDLRALLGHGEPL